MLTGPWTTLWSLEMIFVINKKHYLLSNTKTKLIKKLIKKIAFRKHNLYVDVKCFGIEAKIIRINEKRILLYELKITL